MRYFQFPLFVTTQKLSNLLGIARVLQFHAAEGMTQLKNSVELFGYLENPELGREVSARPVLMTSYQGTIVNHRLCSSVNPDYCLLNVVKYKLLQLRIVNIPKESTSLLYINVC